MHRTDVGKREREKEREGTENCGEKKEKNNSGATEAWTPVLNQEPERKLSTENKTDKKEEDAMRSVNPLFAGCAGYKRSCQAAVHPVRI